MSDAQNIPSTITTTTPPPPPPTSSTISFIPDTDFSSVSLSDEGIKELMERKRKQKMFLTIVVLFVFIVFIGINRYMSYYSSFKVTQQEIQQKRTKVPEKNPISSTEKDDVSSSGSEESASDSDTIGKDDTNSFVEVHTVIAVTNKSMNVNPRQPSKKKPIDHLDKYSSILSDLTS